jgi:hypothetical protein
MVSSLIMKKLSPLRMSLFLIPVILIILWILYGYFSIRNIEKPSYTTTKTIESTIEIRKYEPMIIAEATVNGPYDKAINNGFRIIADYIFGNNTSDTPISMTSPVVQEPKKQSGKIAMTTPVLQEATDNDQFTISFVMPSEYSMKTIPKPNTEKITLREVPSRTLGVIQFSGLWTSGKAKKYTETLRKSLEGNGYTPQSKVEFARYNPPWTPPWMRRNEIWIEL